MYNEPEHNMNPSGRGFRVPMPSGIFFYPEDPDWKEMHIEDVAHKLAFQCRYGGATSKYYSIAEHCVILSKLIQGDRRTKRNMLMHDLAEYAIQDFMRPLKQLCQPWYRELEDKIESQGAIAFQVDFPMRREVALLDLRICVDEKVALINPQDAMNEIEKMGPIGGIDFHCWDPYEARSQFMKQWEKVKP